MLFVTSIRAGPITNKGSEMTTLWNPDTSISLVITCITDHPSEEQSEQKCRNYSLMKLTDILADFQNKFTSQNLKNKKHTNRLKNK